MTAGHVGGSVHIALGQIDVFLTLRVIDEHVKALAVLPEGPVPIHQVIGHVRLDRAFAHVLGDIFIAFAVRAAFGKDFGEEHDAPAVGEPLGIAHPHREIGELLRLAPVHRQAPRLVAVTAGGYEEQRFAVGRPAGMIVCAFVLRHAAKPGPVGIHQVDVGVALAFLEIVLGDAERNPLAVGGILRIDNAFDIVEILDGKGALLSRNWRRDEQN